MTDQSRVSAPDPGPGETGFAVFDETGSLLEANAAIPGIAGPETGKLIGAAPDAVLARLGEDLSLFDGCEVDATDKGIAAMIARWQALGAPPVEARSKTGKWWLLTAHPRPSGGIALISVDFTEAKLAQIRQAEEEEIFRCITDSHPLPVWVADEETGEIIYESMPASQLLKRLWDPEKPQYIQDHYEDPSDREEVKAKLQNEEVLHDHEVRFKDAHDQPFWISANVRRGTYQGRNTLIAGILDITERKRAEEDRRQADAVLRHVLEACPVPVQMTRARDGNIMYRSPQTIELFGEAASSVSYYVDATDRHAYLKQLHATGEIDDYRVQMLKADGSVFWGSVSARLIDFEGEAVIVSNTVDLTETIASENRVRRANERLIDAIESLNEGFALYDKDDRLVMCNSRYRQMHHVSADALEPGVNWFKFLRTAAERKQFPVEPDQIDEWLAERARDRHEYRSQEFMHTAGGWYLVTNSPTREGGFVVTRMDVTERKEMERQQQEAGELVKKVLEACPVAILMNRFDNGEMLYRSPAATALFGNTSFAHQHYADPAQRERFLGLLREKGAVDDFPVEVIGNDGRHFNCAVSSRLIEYQGETVIVTHSQDLTDREAIEAELARQREILHQSEKLSALGELLAGVAHELNNPLSVVVGQSLLLKETAVDETVRKRADKIGNAADRCARIVKTFLAMARQRPAKTTNVDIAYVLENAIEMTGYALRTAGIDLAINLDPDLPDVWGDDDQLGQVFTNLLINAEQALAGTSGRRKIKIVGRFEPATNEVVVKVADTGPGIPDNIRSRIFEPFFTTKEVGTGTGIGLAFCHRIIETHGGVISARANPGGGTAFFIRLPASSKPAATCKPEAEEVPADVACCVLVIDDEPEVADLICEILTSDGSEVTIAHSGAEALRKLSGARFDAILSDLNMPELNGAEFLERIEKTSPELVERLAFVTGDTMSPRARKFLDRTGRPYLEKPIRPSELRELVARLLGDRR